MTDQNWQMAVVAAFCFFFFKSKLAHLLFPNRLKNRWQTKKLQIAAVVFAFCLFSTLPHLLFPKPQESRCQAAISIRS
jgi:hypothetical protein